MSKIFDPKKKEQLDKLEKTKIEQFARFFVCQEIFFAISKLNF